MHRLAFVFSMVLVLLFTLSGSANGQEKSNQVFRVGVEDVDYFPMFTVKGDRDNPVFLTEVLELFATEHDLQFEYIYLPISRFGLWYESDDIDFRIPDHPLWHQEAQSLIFSQDVLTLSTKTVVLKDQEFKPFEAFDTIGTIQGFNVSPQWTIKVDAGDVEVVHQSSVKILLRLLSQGLLDGLDINLTVAKHYAAELGYDPNDFVAAKNVPEIGFSYTLSTQSHPEIIALFNRFLRYSRDDINALKRKHNLLSD